MLTQPGSKFHATVSYHLFFSKFLYPQLPQEIPMGYSIAHTAIACGSWPSRQGTIHVCQRFSQEMTGKY